MWGKSQLVINEQGNNLNQFQVITCNLDTVNVRHDILEGRNHLVVPMVMLLEGVHQGSGGPLYYPESELSKTPVVWNHKPIVVYHPIYNGQPISACDPAVIESSKVGLIMNTRWEDGKLKSEAWLEVNRCDKVDKRIMKKINKKEMIELSTGVFTDNEDAEGEWNGEKYTAIARNYRPDHLALLPDQKGACSIKDGAGLMRNQEVGFEEIRRQLSGALVAKNPSQVGLWIEEVYKTYFIYQANGRYCKQEYELKEGKAVALGIPTEVVRVVSYVENSEAGEVDYEIKKIGGKYAIIYQKNNPRIVKNDKGGLSIQGGSGSGKGAPAGQSQRDKDGFTQDEFGVFYSEPTKSQKETVDESVKVKAEAKSVVSY